MSARLKLTLSYAGIVVLSGVLLLAAVALFLLRYVPDVQIVADIRVPNRSDLIRAFVPVAATVMLALLGIGFGGGWLLAGRMLAPLDRIGDAARLAAQGSLSHRVRLEGPRDEFRDLADVFDGMLEQLEAHVAEQQRFAANASHELRTPLAIIKASASHALSRNRSADEYAAALHEIEHAAERATIGVGELLDLARLDAGQAQPRLAPLRLDLLAEEVAGSVRLDGVTIAAAEGEALVVQADYALLRQVVENLARNAAARATTVWLSTGRSDRWGVLLVADDGPGFDPDVLPHVFDRFRRGDGKGSSGLGMAIAKSIVEAHGGRIEAQNRPDGGAMVRIAVPLAPEA